MASLLEEIGLRKMEFRRAAEESGVDVRSNDAAQRKFGVRVSAEDLEASYSKAAAELKPAGRWGRVVYSENPERRLSVADIDFIERATGCQTANPRTLVNQTLSSPNPFKRALLSGTPVPSPLPAGYATSMGVLSIRRYNEQGQAPSGSFNVLLGKGKSEEFQQDARRVLFHEAVHFLARPQHTGREDVSDPFFVRKEQIKALCHLRPSRRYAEEEMVAELGSAALMMSVRGELVSKDSASYVDYWAKTGNPWSKCIPEADRPASYARAFRLATVAADCARENAARSVADERAAITAARKGTALGRDSGLDLAAAHADQPAASSYLDARKAYLDAPTIEGARNVAACAYNASLDLAFDPDGKAFASVAADAAKRVQWLEAAERGDTSWFRLESVPERQAEALRFRAAECAVEGPAESVAAAAPDQGLRLSDALVLAMVVSSRDVEPGPIHAVCRAEKDLGLAPTHEVDRDRGRGR